MNIEFNENSHRYKIDGEYVPGCTTICGVLPKEWSMGYVAKCNTNYMLEEIEKFSVEHGNNFTYEEVKSIILDGKNAYMRKSNRAMESGTIAHDFIDKYIQFQLNPLTVNKIPEFPLDVKALNSVNLFMKWVSENNILWYKSEVVVGSKSLKCAGKIDWYAYVNGKKTLGDNKSSAGIYFDQYIQINGGYRFMMGETFPEDVIEQSMILHIPKEGNEFNAHIIPMSYSDNFDTFRHCLELYRDLKKSEEFFLKWKK